MKIAIVGGSGKMGRWFAAFLAREGFQVTLYGRAPLKLEAVARELGVEFAAGYQSLDKAKVVLLSVTIDSFEEVSENIRPFIRPGQLIFDITSVKEFPVEIMHRCFPSGRVLGMHPLFGPGAHGLAGQNFVLTPTGPEDLRLAEQARDYLEKKGARVVVMTPREHDEMMAVVLGLAHFIAIVAADTLSSLDKMGQYKAIGGSTYRVLTTLVESVISEDPELYATLQMRLPGLAEIEAGFQQKAGQWAGLVRGRERNEFVRRMTDLKKTFAEGNSDFGQAYENMYKIIEWL